MTWTTTPPTRDGFYWWRESPADKPRVREKQDDTVLDAGVEMWDDLAKVGGEWWPDPVEPPCDAADREAEQTAGFANAARDVYGRLNAGDPREHAPLAHGLAVIDQQMREHDPALVLIRCPGCHGKFTLGTRAAHMQACVGRDRTPVERYLDAKPPGAPPDWVVNVPAGRDSHGRSTWSRLKVSPGEVDSWATRAEAEAVARTIPGAVVVERA